MSLYNLFILKQHPKPSIWAINNAYKAYSFCCSVRMSCPLCMKFLGATHTQTKSAVTIFFSIISCSNFAMPNKQGLRSYMQILGCFRIKILPPQWIEFFWVNQKSNFQTLVLDHVLFKNFSNQLNDIVFWWYFNHTLT